MRLFKATTIALALGAGMALVSTHAFAQSSYTATTGSDGIGQSDMVEGGYSSLQATQTSTSGTGIAAAIATPDFVASGGASKAGVQVGSINTSDTNSSSYDHSFMASNSGSGGQQSESSGGQYSEASGSHQSSSSGGQYSEASGGQQSSSSGGQSNWFGSSGGQQSSSSGGQYSEASGGQKSESSAGQYSEASGGQRSSSSWGQHSDSVNTSTEASRYHSSSLDACFFCSDNGSTATEALSANSGWIAASHSSFVGSSASSATGSSGDSVAALFVFGQSTDIPEGGELKDKTVGSPVTSISYALDNASGVVTLNQVAGVGNEQGNNLGGMAEKTANSINVQSNQTIADAGKIEGDARQAGCYGTGESATIINAMQSMTGAVEVNQASGVANQQLNNVVLAH